MALLEVFGGEMTAKSLQKLLFLFSRDQQVKAYDFVPYYYGCFSFQANQDVVTLGKRGMLNIEKTDRGRFIKLSGADRFFDSLDPRDQQILIKIKSEFGSMSQNELIKYTYVNYPFYAINSRIMSEILSEEDIERVNRQSCHKTGVRLFTIGYEGLTLESYLKKLIINDVRILCDVRKNAYSQKYGFSKYILEKACKSVNIEYIHIPELGIESNKRQSLCTQKDYDILFDEYERTTLAQNKDALLKVMSLINNFDRVALTCFERNPMQCHRSRVAKALLNLSNNIDFKVIL